MYTYQDLQEKLEREQDVIDFCLSAINTYKNSEEYDTALIADEYYIGRNTTITNYRKLIYDITGKAVPDNYSANHKCAANFFKRFVVQQTSFLLGNGVMFRDMKNKDRLGSTFDKCVYKIGLNALKHGVCYGFWNFDHIEILKATEFVPLFDEENGRLRAGVRFWQLDSSKPLRFTLYEEDGFTEFIRRKGKPAEVFKDKQTYKIKYTRTGNEVTISSGGNYDGFPIVPMYANEEQLSELVGKRENIDAYDLIKSGFANDLDDVSMIYWTLENTGGMSDVDLRKFVERMRVVKAAVVGGDEGAKAESHTIEVPYQSRTAYLERLEADLYRDFMALDVTKLQQGQTTNAQIKSAYEPLNEKADLWEFEVIDFIDEILKLAGIQDETPTFNRSVVINESERTQNVIAASMYLDDETIIKHLPFLTPDEIEIALESKIAEDRELAEEEAEAEQMRQLEEEARRIIEAQQEKNGLTIEE